MLGGIEGRRRGRQRMRWLDGITNPSGDGQGGEACCGSWGHKELDTTEQLNGMSNMFLCCWHGRSGPAGPRSPPWTEKSQSQVYNSREDSRALGEIWHKSA